MTLWRLRRSLELTQKFEFFSELHKPLDYVKSGEMSKENLTRFLVLPVSQQGRNTRLAFVMTFKYIYLLVPTRTRCVLGQGKRVIKAMENSFRMVPFNFGARSDHLLFCASLNTPFWNCQDLEVFLRCSFIILEIHISNHVEIPSS